MPALKAVLASRADVDALPEALRGFYVEQDGKFVLDAEVEDHPKVGGLKSALKKERDAKDTADKDFKALRDKIGDMDPDKARDALKKIQDLAEKKLLDEGQIEELMKTRTGRMQADHETQVGVFKKQLDERDGKLKVMADTLRTMRITDQIKTLAIDKKVRREAVEDAIARFTVVGIDGVKWDVDENGQVVAKRGDQIAYGKDATKPMSFDEGFEILAQKAGHLFETSAGGGAKPSTGNNSQPYVLSVADSKDPVRYREAKAAAEKAGQTLSIAAA